ncbi:MAG: protein kinase, partial [Bifidobacteriaceae bacterium]|nr:protein kinase [Bifidobacteriaceae bacterium]
MTAVPPPAPTAPEGSGGTGYGTGAAAPTAFEPTASGAWAASGPAPTAYEPPVTGGASGSGEPAWLRANLPPDLQLRFEPLRSLNVVGGQADLIVCRDRERGGDEVVVKLYRYSDQLDRSVLAKLYQADPTHVVRLLDHGESHRVPWEAQEYCRNGTLADLRQRLGGRVPVDQLPHIVRELAEALGHIHALGITHRDFKPQNVLVRRPGPPPDLVLTDFGVAREQFQATQFTSISATFAWAAPEVHEGVLKAPLDWWALGATVFELLTGRHLLADASGRLPPDVQLRPIVMRGLYSTAQIPPGRWRDLVDGLLTHNPDRRWGYPQVDAWLRGDNPPVDRTGPALGRTASGQPGGALARLVFNGQPVISGVELAAAARRDWSGAARLMAGDIDPATREWLSSTAEGLRALQELRLETGAEARLVRLQGALDPRTPIQFRGRALTDQTLSEAMAAAARLQPDGPSEADDAAEWLLAVRDQRALRALAGAGRVDQAVGERLGRADLILDQWRAQTRAVARRVVDAELAELVELREKALIGQFFAIALGAAPAAP